MRINPKTQIRDYEGKPWTQGADVEPITLKSLIFMALNQPLPEEPWNADSRMKIFEICVKLGNDVVELDDGEPTFILDRANKLGNGFSPLAYARLKEILKPTPLPALQPDDVSPNGAVDSAPVSA